MRRRVVNQTQKIWEGWTSRDPNERPLKWASGLYLGMEPSVTAPIVGKPEDSVGIVGPPRVGKTTGLLIPQILLWLGPIIVASTKDDVLRETGDRRAWLATKRYGTTMVYSPTERENDTGMLKARWSPLSGCADPITCTMRANSMVTAAAQGVENADYWQSQAAMVVKAYFHAAAVTNGYGISDVMGWLTTGELDTPAELLTEHGSSDAARWAQTLLTYKKTSDRERASVWAVARSALAVLDNSVVLENSSETDLWLEPERFVSNCNTLYIVAPAEHQAATAPLISALIESIVSAAIKKARSSATRRLDPPLLLLLDEVANIAPLPSLPSILSQGGGQGVLVSWAAQSLSQLRSRWGNDVAETIWASSRAKVIFGGLSDQRDLETLSRNSGEVMVDVGNGVTQPRPRLPVDYLANLTKGWAVVSNVGITPNLMYIPDVHDVPLFAGELGWHPSPPRLVHASTIRWGTGLIAAEELDALGRACPGCGGTGCGLCDGTGSVRRRLIVSPAGPPDSTDRPPSVTLGTCGSAHGVQRLVSTGAGTSTLRIMPNAVTAPAILAALDDWGLSPAIVLTEDTGMVNSIRDAVHPGRMLALYDPGNQMNSDGLACAWNPISPVFWDQWHALELLSEHNILLGGSLWAAAIADRSLEDIDAWMEMDNFTPALGAITSFVAQNPERDTPFFHSFRGFVNGPASGRTLYRSRARSVLAWLAPQVRAQAEAGLSPLVPKDWVEAGGILVGLMSDRRSDLCVRALAKICSRSAEQYGAPALFIHDRLREDEKTVSIWGLLSSASPCRVVFEVALDPDRTPWGRADHQLIDLPISDRRVLARVESELSEFAPRPSEEWGTTLLLSRALDRPCILHQKNPI